ncbi:MULTISPECIES: F390 synthetase-related protein [Nostocales]|uniref:Adenylate cyclase n=3 Tax=Nostocales TaxID=1161 RepID=A0A8S9T7X8_9CYAN|nr:F390 synthetase-related protein [Tolypothrix bouteillei]KAF3887523.1 adenylate cyclase [Tolypothrix bouteillei VB521301]
MNGLLRILWYYLQTKYRQPFRDRESLTAWQNKKVQKFLQEILTKSPFYRNLYQKLDIENWQEFPIIDKSIMMANFDQLNTVGVKKSEALTLALEAEKTRNFNSTLRGFTVGLSSGTSGNRGLFIVSQKEQQAWAGTILAKALPQSILTPQRIAFFLRANSNLYETVNRKHIQFEYFDLFNSVESHIERLNQYASSILVAPPSMLRLLADAQTQGDLKIAPLRIVSVAEVLDPLDEAYIRRCFQQTVHQLYQCTEGFLGRTCEYGTLHLNEDILAIQKEYIDRNAGKFMPIITDFNRKTQPIIRYRLDDILTECQKPCPCGSVLTAIHSVDGRRDDIFYLPHKNEEKLVPLFPDFIRRAIILSSEKIQEYAVVQKRPNLIEISLKVASAFLEESQAIVYKNLLELFEQQQCQIPEICYKEYETRTVHYKKLRRVQREFSIDTKI